MKLLKRHTVFIGLLLVMGMNARAQDIFLKAGRIEFEKTINLYKVIEDQREDGDNDWMEQIKKTLPQSKLSYFNLVFDSTKSLYKPGREESSAQPLPSWVLGPAQSNVVYEDFVNHVITAQKTAYEATFLIKDTAHINWKITSDKRVIAGFNCRKATTILMDSVFVVAFYCDQIIPSGGPESFSGLPGMILGLAIPRLHTTWFATKIEKLAPLPGEIVAPTKGKKVNNKQLVEQLKSSMSDWGKWGQRMQWQILL